MDKLQNILSQKIGIFYKDLQWEKEAFYKILEYYHSLDMIEFYRYSTWVTWIVLKDGTEIRFMKANEKCRGYKFTKAIIQPEVDQSIIDNVIRPCIVPIFGYSLLYF